jgi:hypothetical protein
MGQKEQSKLSQEGEVGFILAILKISFGGAHEKVEQILVLVRTAGVFDSVPLGVRTS